jgi:AraC-like DNA-binding protein
MLDLVKRFGYVERPLYLTAHGLSLHGSPVSAGVAIQKGTATYDWHGLKRGSFELALVQHTLRGRGMLTFEGETHEISAGQTLLLSVPHDHRYFARDDVEWEFFYVCLSGTELNRLFRDLIERSGPVVTLDPKKPALTLASSLCAQILDSKLSSPFEASALAYGLTMSLLDEAAGAAESVEKPDFFRRVETFCRKNFSKPIGVDDMAKAAQMSRYHFTRRFRQTSGMSPGRYLGELRLREAVRLLQDSDLPVREIATRTGHGDASYLFKLFQQKFGISTRAFRRTRVY